MTRTRRPQSRHWPHIAAAPREEPFMGQKFTLSVNGKTHTIEADPDMPLLYALRDQIGLNNPHFGCGLAQCGACTVHLDGQPIRSCVTPLSSVGDGKVVTLARSEERRVGKECRSGQAGG